MDNSAEEQARAEAIANRATTKSGLILPDDFNEYDEASQQEMVSEGGPPAPEEREGPEGSDPHSDVVSKARTPSTEELITSFLAKFYSWVRMQPEWIQVLGMPREARKRFAKEVARAVTRIPRV